MIKRNYFIVLSVIGLIGGLAAGTHLTQSGEENYCKELGNQMRANDSFEGPVACFEPGEFEQENLSEVENYTDLECLCEYNLNGEKQVFAIRKTQ